MRKLSGGCSSPSSDSGASRRQFLKTGAMTLGGLALPELLRRPVEAAIQRPLHATILPLANAAARGEKSVLFVYLAGGPSQLDMYDMKPDAPAEIRGEFRPTGTNVSGVRVCEHLPLHAKIADKFAIVNGLETIDTHSAAVVTSGYPASEMRPGFADGSARAFLNKGVVQFQNLSLPHGDWDTHGRILGRKLSIFDELRDKLPAYDHAIHGLITDIYDRGLDQDVLLVACGEFGRTPWINQHGGRNHWAPSGSVLFAGGGLKMGQVIGDTGPIGERDCSRSRPYTAQNVLATIYRHLRIDPTMTIRTADGRSVPLLDDARPIAELI
jgi:MYXO-CTERM domain-containing protein